MKRLVRAHEDGDLTVELDDEVVVVTDEGSGMTVELDTDEARWLQMAGLPWALAQCYRDSSVRSQDNDPKGGSDGDTGPGESGERESAAGGSAAPSDD